MKRKSKIIFTSLATIAMSACVITGGTYALFTSEDSVNVAVTSGSVSVSATVDGSSFVTYAFGKEYGTTKFENGGTVVWNDQTGELSLNNVTPGDKVEFDVKIENKSTVNVLYRISLDVGVTISEDDVSLTNWYLASALEATATIDGTAYAFGADSQMYWQKLSPETSTMTVPVSVGLPDGADQNHLQGGTVTLTLKVEAVQGNATVDGYTEVSSIAGLQEAVRNDGYIKLTEDLDATSEHNENVPTSSNGNNKYKNYAVFNVVGKETVFDLAGKTIEFSGHDDDFCNKKVESLFYVTDGGKLTITDSVGGGKVIINGMATAVYSVGVDSQAIVEDGIFEGHECEECDAFNLFLYASHGGELYIKGGTFSQTDSKSGEVLKDGTVGATLVCWHGSSNKNESTGDAGINYSLTKVEISGGKFYGVDPAAIIYCDQIGLNQSWGTVNAVAEGCAFTENADGWYELTTLNVKAGETYTVKGDSAPLTVSGEGTLVLENATIAASNGGSALTLAEGFNGKIVIDGKVALTGGKNGSGIYVSEGATLELSGDGSLTATGNGGAEYLEGHTQYSTTEDVTYGGHYGHGIGGKGTIVIDGLDSLTAKGYGEHGFGIGGNVASITIANTKIESVRGGFVNTMGVLIDEKYLKEDPEGGAAIGSSYNGAVITLKNVTIEEALGGSKSAGIGATFWTAVTVNIDGCTIEKVVGGVSAAGIGGSRIKSGNAKDQTVTIGIHDSTVTAIGGYYGAGIGSGYDTYCHTPENFPITTINITGKSVINATGGKYAAGIGTGYHAGGLAGKIESTVEVTAASGEKFYKDTYTKAQDIGFGILDPARDGLDNACSIDYKGTAIGVPAVE